jgi:hypothetical protein
MGIEPTAQAWEAWVLPLYDARTGYRFKSQLILVVFRASRQIGRRIKEGRLAAPFLNARLREFERVHF